MLILASASPRRRELLREYGFDFTVETAAAEELTELPDPRKLPEENARRKALAVAERHPDALVLGADTMILLDGRALGKPSDEADAARMLTELSGRTHEVVTGVALIGLDSGVRECWSECSAVTFRTLTPETVARYMSLVPVLDKAGAYAIQEHGELLLAGFTGERENIIGLPKRKLAARLKHYLR